MNQKLRVKTQAVRLQYSNLLDLRPKAYRSTAESQTLHDLDKALTELEAELGKVTPPATEQSLFGEK